MNTTEFFSESHNLSSSVLLRHLTLINAVKAVAALIAFHIAYVLVASPLRHVPGPLLAKFSNVWRLLAVVSHHVEKTHLQLHEKLGPAVRLGPNMVSISDPNMVSQIYSRKKILSKSIFYEAMDAKVDGKRVQNFFSTRDEHFNTQYVKPVIKLYSMGSLLQMEPLIDKTITFFVQRLSEEFAEKDRPCDMHNWLHYCAWDVVCQITFSRRMGFLDQGADLENFLKNGGDSIFFISAVGMMPWLDKLVDKKPMKYITSVPYQSAFRFAFDRISERRLQTDGHEEESTRDFLDGFIDAQAHNQELVSDQHVFGYLLSNITAGSDTIAVELRSIMYHLCRHKDAMICLQAELDEAKVQVPLLWAQVQSLPYLCACVQEGFRLMPGVVLPLERVVSDQGMTLSDGQTYLPPGTVVGINPYVINRDRDVFGEDPHNFHPERWLRSEKETEDEHSRRVSRMHNTDLTFGAGKRVCTGRNLALLECHKIVGSLVRAFDIVLVDPEREWKTKGSWFMKQSDMDMRLKNRNI